MLSFWAKRRKSQWLNEHFNKTISDQVSQLKVSEMGALNLQGIEFARKGGGNCKERNIQGKAPQFASV